MARKDSPQEEAETLKLTKVFFGRVVVRDQSILCYYNMLFVHRTINEE